MYRHVDDGPADFPLAVNGMGRILDGIGADAAPQEEKSWWDSAINYILAPTLSVVQGPEAWRSAQNATRSMLPPAGVAKQVIPQVAADPRIARLWARVGDLESFGAISATEKVVVSNLIQAGKLGDAEAIVSEKENKAATRSPKSGALSVINAKLPPGFKTHEKLIQNVPNGALYAAAALGGVFLLRGMLKRK